MAAASFGITLRHFLRRIGPHSVDEQSDSSLLARFAAERDEAAFAALVARHGPMVLGVCRRVLHDAYDADDVFQATFLVLASKAAALDGRRPLASWLYIVARNLALKFRARLAQRRSHEKEAHTMLTIKPRNDTAWRELRDLLDAELGQLPEKYRAPLVLCHLEGMTHAAAALELGWPAGSMAKRLARGQQLLRARLASRGLALSSVALAALLAENGSAAVPASVSGGMGRAAALYVAGQSTTSLASAPAVALARGTLQTMSLAKLKIAAGVLLGLAFAGVGAGLVTLHGGTTQPQIASPALAENDPAPADKEKDEAARQLRKKLDILVTLDKGIDPNTPLGDALDFLSDRYDLTTSVDSKAFEAGGVPKVVERPVQLPRMAGVRLGTVLTLLLGQIELDNGMVGGYRFNGRVLEVVPIEPSEPDADALSWKVRQRLLRPVDWPEGKARLAEERDYAITIAETLKLIRTRYDEKVTINQESFAAFGVASLMDVSVPAISMVGDVCLCDLLDLLGELTEGRDYFVRYRIKRDTIELTAFRRDPPAQEPALWDLLEAIREHRQAQLMSAKLTRKLEMQVDLEKAVEPNRLADVLEFISDRYDLTIIVDSQAFAAAGIEKVDDVLVALPAQQNVTLGTLMQKILDQVDKGDWTAQLNPGFALVGRDDNWRKRDFLEIGPLHKHVKHKKPLTDQQWTGFWDDLAGGKSGRVLLALDVLCRFPEQSVPRLGARLKPVAAPDAKKLAEAARWIPDLDSDRFAVRQRATEELEKLGSVVLQPLKKRLQDRPSLELRRRIEQLVHKLEQPPTRVQLREVRAIHILEGLAHPKPKRFWKRWPRATPALCRPTRPGQRWSGSRISQFDQLDAAAGRPRAGLTWCRPSHKPSAATGRC
jgi:RNA polymerase sigma factor (sigma-70 family)